MAEEAAEVDQKKDKTTDAKEAVNQTQKKWGHKVMKHNFTIYPKLLIRSMVHFDLKPAEFLVLLHIVEHWWEFDKNPFPSVDTLAGLLGFKRRHLQDILNTLENKALIKRKPRRTSVASKHQGSNSFDLSGLRAQLELYAKEVEAEEKRKAKLSQMEVTPEWVKGKLFSEGQSQKSQGSD